MLTTPTAATALQQQATEHAVRALRNLIYLNVELAEGHEAAAKFAQAQATQALRLTLQVDLTADQSVHLCATSWTALPTSKFIA